jgi:hypothetical protein
VDPPPARAGFDLEEGLIIAGATAGAVALIALIAILGSRDDDVPDFLTEPPKRRDLDPKVKIGFQATRDCPIVGGNISLACW